jgi:hypothetical protein
MTTSAHNRYIGAHDWVGISCHGLANTHLDALSHSEFEGKVYNGRNWTDACVPGRGRRPRRGVPRDRGLRMPYPSAAMPMPLHMIGCVAMVLCLLDYPEVTTLRAMCVAEGTQAFVLTCAPLAIPGGTGSAVNPIATF